ncbi:hypothetical protein PV327_009890 [Microctonus hyperodae]|uniref:Uncharacterized protein n=1 Tax=Microctonus hyperodae TaxID=165561 RepID=A0AA39F1X4_MICHY|nr:hypothetical protein PV327_009890 [Microctonus hyperodae]
METSVPLAKGKSWKEHNRIHKEKRKKWREERLIKKVKTENAEEVKEEVEKLEENINNEKLNVSTISIAIPGSILDNCQSLLLRTYLAGQIARAACIYKIDEIIVFDDQGEVTEIEKNSKKKFKKDEQLGEGRAACIHLARILQYMECPQYLRKHFFPMHEAFEFAGALNPLDAPHHLRQQDVSLFREGIVTNKPIKTGRGSQVNVGLFNDVHIDKVLTPGLRVTVKIPPNQTNVKKLRGKVVSPNVPRQETGIYWGYTVRLASNLTEIFTKSPYETGYDLTIGTSDKGASIDDVSDKSLKYNHALIVFGGLAGLEAALDADPYLKVDDPTLVFHKYLNICPEQGSRTIRTEEAILLSLSELRTKLIADNPAKPNLQFNNPIDTNNVNNSGMSDDCNSDEDKSSRTSDDNK